ncbi:MAG: hypothetical protein WCW52_03565 [Elusimicrobiales bacterium]|jgi:hypothetical protein
MMEKRLLNNLITIRKPVQTFVTGSKTPVFEYQVLLTGIKARFVPAGTSMSRNVTGQTPKRSFRLFLNPAELKENYEVIRESDGEVFAVTEVKNFYGHHVEAVLESKKCCG